MRLLPAAICGGVLAISAVGAGVAGAQAADPPGNNATIKIDGVDFDDHPNNEPHVGCVFEVDFYGYDEGDLDATVTFTAIPPTESDDPLLVDTVPVGEDAAGGGTDLDAHRSYDLTNALVAIEPHPEQGWHVKLEVNEPGGSIGADNKFKVFWIEGCDEEPPTETTTTTTRPDGTTTTTKPGDNGNGRPNRPTPTPPAAPPVVPDTPITFAG